MKKHILTFTVLASIFCSCQKYTDYTPTRDVTLMNYAYTLFYDMVATPAIAANFAYEFQNFLNLKGEARKNHTYANMVLQYDLNKYALVLPDTYGKLVIDTGGGDLHTPGREWNIFLEEGGKLFEYYKIETPSYYYYSSGLNYRIECKEEGQWEISCNAREGMTRLTLADDKPEERVWLAYCAGSETEAGATGIRSDYSTCTLNGDEDFGISFQKSAADGVKPYSFDGTFTILISSFDELKERAIVLGKPGLAINCITEIRED